MITAVHDSGTEENVMFKGSRAYSDEEIAKQIHQQNLRMQKQAQEIVDSAYADGIRRGLKFVSVDIPPEVEHRFMVDAVIDLANREQEKVAGIQFIESTKEHGVYNYVYRRALITLK